MSNKTADQKLFVDDRHYLFSPKFSTPDGPTDERERLLATVRRIWTHDAVIDQRAGELGSNSLRVQVMVSGHKSLKHSQRSNQDVEPGFLVLDEPATYDVIMDKVKLGSADIQIRNRHLKWNGFGTLMFNAMIAWCYQYHLTSVVSSLLVTDHSASGPTRFYEKFGLTLKGDKTKEVSVSELKIAKAHSRFEVIKKGMIPDYMLPGEWPSNIGLS